MAVTSEELTKALRLARAIASDISLYNEKKIHRSIELDNFFDELKDELDEGNALYKSRVNPEIVSKQNFFERAIVDVILKPKGNIKSKLW